MRSRHGELLLAGGSLLAGCLGLEIGLRAVAWLGNRGLFEQAMQRRVVPSVDRPTVLRSLIRPSPERRRIYELVPDTAALLVNPRGGSPTPVRTNHDGFRDRDYAVPRPPGVRRIVGIGDSYMFGWGVPEGEDYLSVLEVQLNRELPSQRWEVINTAVPGYNTVMEVETLKAKGLAYGPDLVVVGFCWNDIELPNFIRTAEEHLSLRRFFLGEFVWGRLGAERFAPFLGAPRNDDGRFEHDPSRTPATYRDLVGWDAFQDALAELRRLSRRRRFAVVVLAFDPDGGAPAMRATRKHRGLALARAAGFPVIDVGHSQAEYMRAHGIGDYYRSPLTVAPHDPHPSALSHRLAAEALLQYVAGQG